MAPAASTARGLLCGPTDSTAERRFRAGVHYYSSANTFQRVGCETVMGARALGIVRVSQVKGREGDSFASPAEQRERIAQACERDGMVVLDVIDELDVSGGTPLAKRAGLRGAVERIE